MKHVNATLGWNGVGTNCHQAVFPIIVDGIVNPLNLSC